MIKKLMACLFIIALYLPTANAKRLLRDTYGITVVANGKDFFSTYLTITVDGKKYPFYMYDKKGEPLIAGFSFGQIAAELRDIEGAAEEIKDRLGIDSVTFYPDLSIALFETEDPFETESIYLRLKQEPTIRYVEMSFIEAIIDED